MRGDLCFECCIRRKAVARDQMQITGRNTPIIYPFSEQKIIKYSARNRTEQGPRPLEPPFAVFMGEYLLVPYQFPLFNVISSCQGTHLVRKIMFPYFHIVKFMQTLLRVKQIFFMIHDIKS